MIAGGSALAHDADGRVVLVEGALPGERVVVEPVVVKADLVQARVTEVIDASADRVAPPCPYVSAGCGGCGWQHIAPDAQVAYKRDIVLDALQRIARVEIELASTVQLPALGYRTTVRALVVNGRAAFRRAHSHDPIAIDRCLVAHPLVDDILTHGRFGHAREVVVRAGANTGERCALADPDNARIDVADDVAVGAKAQIHEIVDDARFQISARSFFQIRPDGAAALARLVRAAVGPNQRVADLFCGVGLFARFVDEPRSIVAVERDRSAVADARVNLRGRPAKVVRADVARFRPEPVDVVIADPSRAGLGRDGVQAVDGCEPKRVVLVSCDPAACARDIKLLTEHSYRVRSITPVDLFPHTPHVECVTVLDRTRY
jgi:23S rRNA (uracil1939-C5)-methyltransferase